MEAVSVRAGTRSSCAAGAAPPLVAALLKPLQALMAAPSALFLAALAAMLLRHPDVLFYAIDRVAFGILVVAVFARAIVLRRRLFVMERASWPMAGLTLLAVASVAAQPFDSEAWSLLAAKFLVPFTLFHLARLVFDEERSLRRFEMFALAVLAYLSFTAIAFLVGAKELIFPRFILDPSLGHHVDRARGPLLQAVANGVSLNMLGLLAFHSFRRGRFRGLKAWLLLVSVPVAILATMTRAVWLSFSGTIFVLTARLRSGLFWRAAVGLALIASAWLLCVLFCPDLENTLAERFEERGPVDFREAVYTGGWAMFLERPLTGWGINQMPAELARHVSGYKEKVLYPHNTYLELLVEHGVAGLALYVWLMWELWRLRRGRVPWAERDGFLDKSFHLLWPLLLGVYWVNAALVVMNYQFVNGLLFTLAGMLAAQQRRAMGEAC